MPPVKDTIRQFLLDNFVMGANAIVADDTSFMKGRILDSTGFIELITFIEETFELTVDDDEMLPENFDSLNNIDHYIGRKLASAASA